MMVQDSSLNISAIPHINLGCFLQNPDSDESIQEAKRLTQALIEYGCFVAKDPRISEELNSEFIDLMEKYYDRPTEEVLADAYPEVSFQIGVTPPGIEEPRCKRDPACHKVMEKLSSDNLPIMSSGPDPKWRYMWRVGKDCQTDKLQLLNKKQIVPKGFPAWESTMNTWGELLFDASKVTTEMLAVGFGLPKNRIKDYIIEGSQLLSPTGTDLSKLDKENDIIAGYHYDLGFLTIHGKTRFPGLNIWAKDNTIKIPVSVPDGFLLIQAGRQLERLTGGVIKAGYHEVIVTKETIATIENARKDSSRSLWRVGSILLTHIQPDLVIEPLKELQHFSTFDKERYPPIVAYDYIVNELAEIKLLQETS